MTEEQRKAEFRAHPGFADYLSTMLQDLQYNENDNACEDEREPGDTGTIYTLNGTVYASALADWRAFESACGEHIAAAVDLVPGEDGLRSGREYMTHERIGSTFYLSRAGHGVGFTDDGDAPCLVALETYAQDNPAEYYFDGTEVRQ